MRLGRPFPTCPSGAASRRGLAGTNEVTAVSSKGKGFTLIELLVVIAIIAILAAILFPVFIMTKHKAQQAKCASNMRQLGIAMMTYADDYKGALPLPCNANYDWLWDTWRERVRPYCKNWGILACPSPNVDKGPDETAKRTLGHRIGHYGMCMSLTHRPQTQSIPPCRDFGFSYLSEIEMPARTILVAENRDGDWSAEPYHTYPGDSGWAGHLYPYHGSPRDTEDDPLGGSNFIFCDGHAKWLTISQNEANYFYLWWKFKSITYH